MENQYRFIRNNANEYDVKIRDLTLRYNMATDEISIIRKYSSGSYERDNFNKQGEIKSASYVPSIGLPYTDIYKDSKIVLRRREDEADYIFNEPQNSLSYINYIEKSKKDTERIFTLYDAAGRISKIGLDTINKTFSYSAMSEKNTEKTTIFDQYGRIMKEKLENKKTNEQIETTYIDKDLLFITKRKNNELQNIIMRHKGKRISLNLGKLSEKVKEKMVNKGIITEREVECYMDKINEKRERLFKTDDIER